MKASDDPHVLHLPTTRAMAARKARQALSAEEYKRLGAVIPDLDLEGGPFDEGSWVYPLEVPAVPRVVLLGEDPRVVSVGLRDGCGRFVGVVGDEKFEQACVEHAGAMLYAVGTVVKRQKGEKAYLNLRPRGWVVVEETAEMSKRPASDIEPNALNPARGKKKK